MLVILGYVGFLALLLEGSMRLAFAIPQISGRLRADEDYTWRRDWVQRHRDSGMDISYSFDVYDPSRGWRSKPDIRDMTVFGDKILNTNANGLRGTREYPFARENDKLRILVLGDSFTFGDEVSDNENYCHYLQEMLPRTEILNAGVHGYGHDQMLILLKEEGVRYKPDIVLLGFVSTDMPRNLLTFRSFAKPRFVLRRGELTLTGTPVPRPEDILRSDWTRPRTVDILSIMRYRLKRVSGLHQEEMESVTTAILREMIGVIEGIPAVPVIVYLPTGSEIGTQVGATESEAYLASICRSDSGAECFSARPYFAERIAAGQTFKTVGHWDPPGHLAVAEAIRDYLIDAGHVTPPTEGDGPPGSDGRLTDHRR